MKENIKKSIYLIIDSSVQPSAKSGMSAKPRSKSTIYSIQTSYSIGGIIMKIIPCFPFNVDMDKS